MTKVRCECVSGDSPIAPSTATSTTRSGSRENRTQPRRDTRRGGSRVDHDPWAEEEFRRIRPEEKVVDADLVMDEIARSRDDLADLKQSNADLKRSNSELRELILKLFEEKPKVEH